MTLKFSPGDSGTTKMFWGLLLLWVDAEQEWLPDHVEGLKVRLEVGVYRAGISSQ